MADTLGVGIHGAGWVANEHLNAYMANPHCEVVAVSSRREASARKAAELCGAPQAAIYTDYEQFLADDNLDLISITTPNHLHVEEGVAAAQAGKHFIMEKPMALSVEGVYALRDAVAEAGVKTVVSFVLHWCPSLINAKRQIAEGAIGEIFYVEADYWHGVDDWYPGWDWAITKEMGGSSFLFGGCHAVDAARWLTGLDIVEVSAYGGGWDDRYEYPATVVASVKYSNGVVGKLSSSVDIIAPYQFNIDILGDQGAIRDNKLWSRILAPEADDWTVTPAILPDSGDVEHHPFEGEINHIVDCILNDVESDVNVADAVNTHEACLAIDMSAEQDGATVTLPVQ
ncbi:MAG: Gfo/Idh/MocA family protein [Armatimonadota bacterium]